MSSSPEKSVSYIIGGSSGMGLATAKLLVADGATVVVIGRDAKSSSDARTSCTMAAVAMLKP
jgi:NAD(P)-dependent dehydrogenase (short-subunit alcohol dehydrogenase family)